MTFLHYHKFMIDVHNYLNKLYEYFVRLMNDVFSRLFRDSTNRKDNKITRNSRRIRKEDEDKWKLRLAAGCYLVDNQKFQAEIQPEVYSSLSSTSLHRKRAKSKNPPKPTDQKLNTARRRKIQYVMDKEGTIQRTDNYIVTDSVEPPPYQVMKPKKSIQAKYYDKKSELIRVPRFSLSNMQKEIEDTRPPRIEYGQASEVITTQLDVKKEEGQYEPEDTRNNVIMNADEVFDVDKDTPKAVTMLSSMGQNWDNCGYPTSVSFFLEAKNS